VAGYPQAREPPDDRAYPGDKGHRQREIEPETRKRHRRCGGERGG